MEYIVKNEGNNKDINIHDLTEAKRCSSFKESLLVVLSLSKGDIRTGYVIKKNVQPYLKSNMNRGEEDNVDINEEILNTRST